jgi:hypothetical protein
MLLLSVVSCRLSAVCLRESRTRPAEECLEVAKSAASTTEGTAKITEIGA